MTPPHFASLALAVCGAAVLAAWPAAADAQQAGADAAARALFMTGTTPPCALCHTLKDAGSSGAVGPVLDELQPDEARVATALRTGIGAMPSYQATLSAAQIAELARYVAKASGGAR